MYDDTQVEIKKNSITLPFIVGIRTYHSPEIVDYDEERSGIISLITAINENYDQQSSWYG